MKLKLKKNLVDVEPKEKARANMSTALVSQQSSDVQRATLLGLDNTLVAGAEDLGIPVMFLVECWLSGKVSRGLATRVFNDSKLYDSLKELEGNAHIRGVIEKSRSFSLSTAERRTLENTYLTEQILHRKEKLLNNLFVLADGYELAGTDKKGHPTYQDVGPSLEANKYLLDRGLGKPTTIVETDGGGPKNIQNVIILPSNGRGDEKLSTRDISSITDVDFREG